MNFSFKESDCKAVIFDFDGTLYDFRHLPWWLILLSPWNIPKISAERRVRRRLKGRDFLDREGYDSAFYGELARELNIDFAEAKRWYEVFYTRHMVRVLKFRYRARRGVQKLLESLRKRHVKIAVFSDYPLVQDRLSAIGLQGSLFDVVVSSAEMGGFKPSSRLFHNVAAQLGVDSSQCLVVGDRNDTDGEGARSCGMDFVQVRNHKMLKADAASLDYPLLKWEEFLAAFGL